MAVPLGGALALGPHHAKRLPEGYLGGGASGGGRVGLGCEAGGEGGRGAGAMGSRAP